MDTVDAFLRLLALRRDGETFTTEPGGAAPGGTMYGGALAAQLLMAGAALTALPQPHALHVTFLRPGDPTAPVTYRAQTLRESRGFATLRIVGGQEAGPVVDGTVSFTAPREGIDHQSVRMPAAPAPEAMVPWWRALGMDALPGGNDPRPVEMRGSAPAPAHARGDMPNFLWWCRPLSPLPDDGRLHAAMLVSASDFVAAPLAGYYRDVGVRQASLDHAVWFHDAPRFEGWNLYQVESPRAAQGRALLSGWWFRPDGTLLLTAVQEALYR